MNDFLAGLRHDPHPQPAPKQDTSTLRSWLAGLLARVVDTRQLTQADMALVE